MRKCSKNDKKELNEALSKILKSKRREKTKSVMIMELLKSGANINYHDDHHGNTLLHNASTVSDIHLLLKLGANINAKNLAGETPLLRIIRMVGASTVSRKKIFLKTRPIIRELLRYGPNLNLKDSEGNSPLFEYVCNNECNLNIVKLMVNSGADIYINNNDFLLHAAVSNPYCKEGVVKYFIDLGFDPNAVNDDEETPLQCHVKSKYCNHGVVKELLKYGMDSMKQDFRYSVPLCPVFHEPRVKIQRLSQVELKSLCRPCTVIIKDYLKSETCLHVKQEQIGDSLMLELDQNSLISCEQFSSSKKAAGDWAVFLKDFSFLASKLKEKD